MAPMMPRNGSIPVLHVAAGALLGALACIAVLAAIGALFGFAGVRLVGLPVLALTVALYGGAGALVANVRHHRLTSRFRG